VRSASSPAPSCLKIQNTSKGIPSKSFSDLESDSLLHVEMFHELLVTRMSICVKDLNYYDASLLRYHFCDSMKSDNNARAGVYGCMILQR
jgi:hypothetical protein